MSLMACLSPSLLHFNILVKAKACCVQEDDHDDFTSIWVFKPRENSFKVYQQFTITANVGNPLQPFTLVPPPGGYGAHGFTAATP